ncbi:MAG: Homoserine kinase [Acidimicrobiaceae bacterium]|nr:Homoserine kinase [Acidimicrobiaceae bacterium]
MRARAPASSANLGPGFDALAVALDRYVEVEVRGAPTFVLHSEGEGSEIPPDGDHLAARVVRKVLGHDRFAVRVRSQIPLGRGLGSSAALAAAAAAAAGASDPLAVAAEVDGHAENAAASVLGGLVVAAMIGGRPVSRCLPLDPSLAYVALVPDRRLATVEARSVLPSEVPFADAVANLGRMGLLLAGLADGASLEPFAGEDRLHQGARAQLFPQAPQLLARLVEAGAAVACWSGAGPSLLAICRSASEADRVREAGEVALAEANVAGEALRLSADLGGLVVEKV